MICNDNRGYSIVDLRFGLFPLYNVYFGDNVFRFFLLVSSKVEFLNQILAVL